VFSHVEQKGIAKIKRLYSDIEFHILSHIVMHNLYLKIIHPELFEPTVLKPCTEVVKEKCSKICIIHEEPSSNEWVLKGRGNPGNLVCWINLLVSEVMETGHLEREKYIRSNSSRRKLKDVFDSIEDDSSKLFSFVTH
jgi:hypothetical protein